MPVDELTYPAPVANRQGPAGAAVRSDPFASPSPPRSYVFGFVVLATAGNRSTTSSPRLKGPSIIRGLHVAKGGTPEGRNGIVLGKALSSVSEVNVAVAVPRPYTTLFTGLPAAGVVSGAPNDAVSHIDMQTTVLSNDPGLGIIVLEKDWFLTVTVAALAAITGDEFHGYVTVLDEVPLETLRNFL